MINLVLLIAVFAGTSPNLITLSLSQPFISGVVVCEHALRPAAVHTLNNVSDVSWH